MAKNENTVTLPAPAAGNVWRQVPAAVKYHIAGSGKINLDIEHNYDPELPDCISDHLLGCSVRQGDKRYIGTATTSAKEGESELEAVQRRNVEFVAGTYRPGAGGGRAHVDTYTIVLREKVLKVLANVFPAKKKTEAEKAVKDSPAAAFSTACAKTAEGGDKTEKEIFEDMFPKIEAAAKKEADRRDSESSFTFDLGDFAPE